MEQHGATLTFGNADAANCKCDICRRNAAFAVPKELFADLLTGDAIIFAGAGISTENSNVGPDTFYDEIRHALGTSDTSNVSFPDLMQKFVDLCGDRHRLMQILEKRLKNISAFRDRYEEATRFHQELSTLFFIKTLITTNWGRHFEDVCGFTPFVYDADLPFWDSAERQLLKIHGSIDNRGSIVATRQDYDNIRRKAGKSLLFRHLSSLVARKTMLFIGYSVRDETFLAVFNDVRRALGQHHRTPYLVSPNASKEDLERLSTLSIRHIRADGAFFLKSLKHYAHQHTCIIPDEQFNEIEAILNLTREVHDKTAALSIRRFPSIIFSLSYQDGIQHACERILKLKGTGEYSNRHRVQSLCTKYNILYAGYVRKKDYWNASYVRGYMNVLIALLTDDVVDIGFPYFFDFRHKEIEGMDTYKRMLRNGDDHEAARRKALDLIARNKLTKGTVLEHRAWL